MRVFVSLVRAHTSLCLYLPALVLSELSSTSRILGCASLGVLFSGTQNLPRLTEVQPSLGTPLSGTSLSLFSDIRDS